MTPAQQQAAKIKELAEQYSDAFADAKSSPWLGRLAALQKVTQEELHTAIDSLASEVDRLQALVAEQGQVYQLKSGNYQFIARSLTPEEISTLSVEQLRAIGAEVVK